uniref:hypothetical protein n=1 Tax=Klebsiella aerogenes TaxID=548 RepID=UPI003F6A0B6D
MNNEIEQIAQQNDMSVEFVRWFFNEKKAACGEQWFLALGAMWEGWKAREGEATALALTLEKSREASGCPAGVDLQDWVKQMAAENVGLKNVFSQKEIPSEAVDAFMETAVMDHDWNETSEWSWVENETEVIHAVLDALKPDTPATDRIVAGIKADGVTAALESCSDYLDTDCVMDRLDISYEDADKRTSGAIEFHDAMVNFANQLREGAGK